MRISKTVFTGASVLLLISVALVAEEQRPMRKFMRAKIEYAQGILEGLTLENYHMAITNAIALRSMTPSNTNYFGLTHVDFQRHTTNFQASVDELIEAARARNLETATEAYQNITKNCVECHKQFRRAQFMQHQLDKR